MSAISPLTWKSPISGRAKTITGIAMIVETKTPKTTDCFSTSSALSRSLAPIYRATSATVPVPTAAIPARTAPRICVASPTAPTASAPSRPTISIDESPSMESSPKERITGHASAQTSERIRSIGGSVIATGPCTSGMTSGIASKKSDMTVDSYASPRLGSQSCNRTRARNPLYVDAARGGDEAGSVSQYRIVTADRIVATADPDLRRDLCRRGHRVLVPTRHRRARRERGLQRDGRREAERRRNSADAGPARSRQTSLLLQRPAFLHADFRDERNFSAFAIRDLFVDHARTGVCSQPRDVRRRHRAS